jgi:hypothetical protein
MQVRRVIRYMFFQPFFNDFLHFMDYFNPYSEMDLILNSSWKLK